MRAKPKRIFEIAIYVIAAAIILLLTAFDLLGIPLMSDPQANSLLTGAVQRLVASVVVVIFIFKLNYSRYIMARPTIIGIVLILPALAIAINNFPIIDYLNGSLEITSAELLPLFIVECLSVGIFEELIFRGFIFLVLLERCKTKKDILLSVIISSAAFGLLHLVNLFAGSGIGATVMQIGYSFLIGAMMCYVLLITNNIFLCMILHALFNFCGLLFPTLGLGNIWSVETIILTVVVSVFAIIFMASVFFSPKFHPENKLKLLL